MGIKIYLGLFPLKAKKCGANENHRSFIDLGGILNMSDFGFFVPKKFQKCFFYLPKCIKL